MGITETQLMSLTGHKNLQSIKHYARMNLKRQGELLSRDQIGAGLQLIIDNAANDTSCHCHDQSITSVDSATARAASRENETVRIIKSITRKIYLYFGCLVLMF